MADRKFSQDMAGAVGAYETERKSAHDFTKYTDCHIVNLYHYRCGHGDE